MKLPDTASTGWWRDRILPVILTAAMLGTCAAGLAMWKELAIISTKIDSRDRQIEDHETRIRELERRP